MTKRKSIYYTSTVSNNKIIVSSFVIEKYLSLQIQSRNTEYCLKNDRTMQLRMCTSYIKSISSYPSPYTRGTALNFSKEISLFFSLPNYQICVTDHDN